MFGALNQNLCLFAIAHLKHNNTEHHEKPLLALCVCVCVQKSVPHRNDTLSGIAHYTHTSTRYIQKHFPDFCGAEVWCTTLETHFLYSACQTHPYEGAKDTFVRILKAERHAVNTHFLALRISNTPILSIEIHVCWQFWCRGMRVRCAALQWRSC